jgi:hypothetical protein
MADQDDHDARDRALAVVDVLRARAARGPITDAQRTLLDFSAKIFDEPATIADAAYLPRELVQVTLPQKPRQYSSVETH